MKKLLIGLCFCVNIILPVTPEDYAEQTIKMPLDDQAIAGSSNSPMAISILDELGLSSLMQDGNPEPIPEQACPPRGPIQTLEKMLAFIKSDGKRHSFVPVYVMAKLGLVSSKKYSRLDRSCTIQASRAELLMMKWLTKKFGSPYLQTQEAIIAEIRSNRFWTNIEDWIRSGDIVSKVFKMHRMRGVRLLEIKLDVFNAIETRLPDAIKHIMPNQTNLLDLCYALIVSLSTISDDILVTSLKARVCAFLTDRYVEYTAELNVEDDFAYKLRNILFCIANPEDNSFVWPTVMARAFTKEKLSTRDKLYIINNRELKNRSFFSLTQAQ